MTTIHTLKKTAALALAAICFSLPLSNVALAKGGPDHAPDRHHEIVRHEDHRPDRHHRVHHHDVDGVAGFIIGAAIGAAVANNS